MNDSSPRTVQISAYELLLVALSVYVLGALLVERLFQLDPQTVQILAVIDTAICAVFLGDFVMQLVQAKDRLRYLRWGWIDLVSSIPALPLLRWGRLVRIVRVVRLLRTVRAAKILGTVVFSHRAKGALATAVFVCLVLVTFGSVAVLHVERDPDSNIRTAGDALWWSLATVATVGYGDKYPVTAEGRALGIVLMVTGVGMFGTFTGYLATWFMERSDNSQDSISRLAPEISALRAEIAEMRRVMSETRDVQVLEPDGRPTLHRKDSN